jgi:hypothetical protein
VLLPEAMPLTLLSAGPPAVPYLRESRAVSSSRALDYLLTRADTGATAPRRFIP